MNKSVITRGTRADTLKPVKVEIKLFTVQCFHFHRIALLNNNSDMTIWNDNTNEPTNLILFETEVDQVICLKQVPLFFNRALRVRLCYSLYYSHLIRFLVVTSDCGNRFYRTLAESVDLTDNTILRASSRKW